MALFSALGVVAGLAAIRFSKALGTTVVSVIVEITSCVLLVEMALSAIKVKRLSRQLEEQEA